jgi:hypothetical protein
MDHMTIINEAKAQAYAVGKAYLDKHYGGHDAGACGFAWVNVYPKHKGNTKEGREERRILREMGFSLDWTGKGFELWNPSGLHCQNVDAKHQGAAAAAECLRAHGFKAYAGSRLD